MKFNSRKGILYARQLSWSHTIKAMLIGLGMSTIVLSCTSDFERINTNPNAPIEVQPGLLLRQVIYDYGEEMSYEGFVAGNLLSQHFTMVDFNLFDRHDLSAPQLGGNPWPVIYENLRDNEILLGLSRESTVNAVYEGPALILKAYMSAALTDIYGPVPYFEALDGKSGNTTPRYDAQESIYLEEGGVLDNLAKAIEILNAYSGVQVLEGDILFDGDLNQWISFANSLRIKYLIRISNRIDVSTELAEIVQADQYISSNQLNATFDFSDSQPNTFRMAVLRAGDFNLYVMSETIEEILQTLNDPRQDIFFRPTEADPTAFLGLLNGPDASATSISVADFSLTGTIFRENTGALNANFMTAWETNFLLAEAAERGLVNVDGKMLYDQAVEQAFEYWNTPIPADYLTDGIAAYGAQGADPIEQIITQKWLANIINGYEGWIEYRRTGFPVLKSVSASLNSGFEDQIPTRMPYPPEEAALNANNYREAAEQTGQNSINAQVWWDQP